MPPSIDSPMSDAPSINKPRASPNKGNKPQKNSRPRNRRRSRSPKSKDHSRRNSSQSPPAPRPLTPPQRLRHGGNEPQHSDAPVDRRPPPPQQQQQQQHNQHGRRHHHAHHVHHHHHHSQGQPPATCIAEASAAAKFLGSCLVRSVGPQRAAAVSAALTEAMLQRYAAHWFPAEPTKGSGFRCLSNSPSRPDPVIRKALRAALPLEPEHCLAVAVRSLPGHGDFCIWVDPQHVSIKVGEYGANTTIYGHQHPVTTPTRRRRSPSPPRSQPRSLSPSARSFTPSMAASASGSPPSTAAMATAAAASNAGAASAKESSDASDAASDAGTPPGTPKQRKSRIPAQEPRRSRSRGASPPLDSTPPPGLGLDARWSKAVIVSN